MACICSAFSCVCASQAIKCKPIEHATHHRSELLQLGLGAEKSSSPLSLVEDSPGVCPRGWEASHAIQLGGLQLGAIFRARACAIRLRTHLALRGSGWAHECGMTSSNPSCIKHLLPTVAADVWLFGAWGFVRTVACATAQEMVAGRAAALRTVTVGVPSLPLVHGA